MIKRTITLLLTLTLMHSARAEDGSRLWLRYEPANKVNVTGAECLAADELKNYYNGPEVTLKLDATLPDEAYQISGNGNKISICAKSEIGLLFNIFQATFFNFFGREIFKIQLRNSINNF